MSFKTWSVSLTIGKQILLLFVVPFLFPCVKASCFPKVLVFFAPEKVLSPQPVPSVAFAEHLLASLSI